MNIFRAGAFAIACAVCLSSARGKEVAAPAPTGSSIPAWESLIESLRGLPDRMLARLPADVRQDPQIRQEVARLALQSLTSYSLAAIGGDADFPEFLPSYGMLLNIAQPNIDTIYRNAHVDPLGTYRLTGRLRSAELAVVSQSVPRSVSGGGAWPELDLSKVKLDGDGRFDVLVSARRPEGHEGDWWPMNPQASDLMLRVVSQKWGTAEAPTISIERLDRPMGNARASAAELESRLQSLAKRSEMIATMFLDRAARLQAEGFVNRLKANVPEGALARQSNYEGIFELADDEALIIESPVPTHCEYRSILLINELYQTIDWYNNHSSLNGEQALPDSDGRLRIVISARDPGVANWLDTSGHRRGIVKGRWTGCDSLPLPEVRKMKFADVRNSLPADVRMMSAEERERTVRERRRAMQQRALW